MCFMFYYQHQIRRKKLFFFLKFFLSFFFLSFFFEVGGKKCVGVPPPLWICCPFWGGPLCLFLDGLGAFLLSQSALRSLKCPFWKWPCPFQILNSSPGKGFLFGRTYPSCSTACQPCLPCRSSCWLGWLRAHQRTAYRNSLTAWGAPCVHRK